MELTQEHLELQRSLGKFIEAEINPYVDEWEENGPFPAHEVFKKMGDLGFLGVDKPEKYGGLGLDYSYAAIFNEALGSINCGGVPMAIGVQTQMATPALAKFGSEHVCEEFLRPAISGDQVCSIAVTEHSAGSDVAAIKTTAVKDGDDYIINGSKIFITNGAQADWMCVLANTSDDPVHKNKSLICVPTKAKGFTVARTLNKLGMHSSDTAELFFEDVRVPQRNRIGDEGLGFTYQMIQFQEERMYAALVALSGMQATIDQTIEYTRDRKIFGQSVLDHQVVHFRIAELQTELEALRALTWKAVDQYMKGEDMTMLASMCKLKATRLQRELVDACLQYWGGMGFMNDTPVTRAFRDGRLGSIGGGADEVMLSIISKLMGTLPGRKK